MTSPMVPWPKADEFGYAFDELSAKDAALRFHRVRYEAAMQRLRVAVRALKENLPAADHNLAHVTFNERAFIETAREALAAIGPLPNDDAKGAG